MGKSDLHSRTGWRNRMWAYSSDRLWNSIVALEVDKLKPLERKYGAPPLADILDEAILYRLCLVDIVILQTLEKEFPGCISRIPFNAAFLSGNTYVLELNKDRYFGSNTDEIVISSADGDYWKILNSGEGAEPLMSMVSRSTTWMKNNNIELPKVMFMEREIQESILNLSKCCFFHNDKEREKFKREFKREFKNMYECQKLYGINMDTLKIENADSLVVVIECLMEMGVSARDFPKLDISRWYWDGLPISLNKLRELGIPFDQVEIENLTCAEECDLYESLLRKMIYKEEDQKLVYDYFDAWGVTRKLKEAVMLHPERMAQFKAILEAFYKAKDQQDEII